MSLTLTVTLTSVVIRAGPLLLPVRRVMVQEGEQSAR